MKKKLIISMTAIILIINFIITVVNINAVKKDYERGKIDELITLVQSVALSLESDYQKIDKLLTLFKDSGIRATIIDKQGKVVFETDESVVFMQSHLNRNEVIIAKEGLVGTDIRYSNSIRKNFLYAATLIPNTDDYVLRLSVPLEVLGQNTKDIITNFIIIISIGIIIAVLLILNFVGYYTKPLIELSNATVQIANDIIPKKLYYNSKDEIGSLYQNFNLMTKKLNDSINELENTNLFLNSILSNIVSGVIALNYNKEIIFINKRCKYILDIHDDELKNNAIINIIRNYEINKFIKDYFDNKINESLVVNYKNKTLKLFINALPYDEKRANEPKYGAVLLVEDISEAVKLEEMRKSFVANVTHELKTPLTSIKGYVETIKSNEITDQNKISRFMNIIDIEADRLKTLIDDILMLSEIENMDGNLSKINLKEVVSEVKDVMHNISIGNNITVNYLCDDVEVFLVRNRVKQLLINLIDNAIKYNIQDGRVDVKLTKQDKFINILVEDTGIGIAKQDLPRIFERFYRVDKSRSRQMGGTGLGLAIVKHIVISFKGTVNIESDIGKGTRITISIPI
jgi:two-component system phosphate regulon sensor histidine kinase PhoR